MKDQRTWAPLTGLRPYRAVRVPVVDRVMTWVAKQFLLTVPGIDDVHGVRYPEQGLGALRTPAARSLAHCRVAAAWCQYR